MAKTKKRRSAKDRIADKGTEKVAKNIVVKEKKVSKTKKKTSKPTLAELKAKALRAQSAMAKLNAQILEASNPELSKLRERLEAAQKAANAHNRFIAMRHKRIRTVERELRALKEGSFNIAGELVKNGLAQMIEAQKRDQELVAQITAEIEAERLKSAD